MNSKIDTRSSFFSWLTLFALAVIWGTSFILMKKGLEVFSSMEVGSLRVVISAVVLLPLAFKNYALHLKKNWKAFLFFAALTNLGPAILFAIAQTKISSSLAGILDSMTPIFTFLIGVLFYSVKFTISQIGGLLLGIVGSGLLILFSGGDLGEVNFFAFFVVLATVLYGVGSNFLSKRFADMNSVALTSLAFMTILPVATLILISSGFINTMTTKPGAWGAFGYITILGVVGTAMSLILFYRLILVTSPVFASTVTYLIPIVAVLWGFIDGEALSIMHIVGVLLIISGVYFINRVSVIPPEP
ncbi:MAG: DMT family transporter [Ignavibacteriales bacterium]|nr:MAG: DMT family transporter [Ignavibacteriaceae bacterium]MBW7873473.1 DMT family transporter [Ignavibacteria bacterium]MCZ2142164.1 DMT family transporter [Ignavibacteriales bacterium]OQY79954.1 MAG: hypothetical protein B6D45_00210 [Ignavibacteriales bacterium UTCHB3]MBV6444899.1 hypothetical protein [Ignavibacteriaceae bacterium]